MTGAPIELLIVDDDAIVCAWLADSLAHTEFRVAGDARSGADALLLLNRRRIDLLLVEFQLHDENGLDLVRGLRAAGRETAAVIMTASPSRG